MKTLYFFCIILIYSSTSARAQTKPKESAFRLQLETVDDKLFVKGWFYQVASRIMRDHPELIFVESEKDAVGFKRVIEVKLFQNPETPNYHKVRIGNLKDDEILVKINYEGVNKASKAIGNTLVRLHYIKKSPKIQIDLCY